MKFSHPDGRILIHTANTENGLVVTVRDRGVGMDDEMLGKLFAPFAQPGAPIGGRPGLGLGLSITKNIVEVHGGQIWASSQGPGTGSTFEVDLPFVDPPPAPAPAPEAKTAAMRPSPRRRALVVEDHRDTGTVLAICLSQAGFDVTAVSTLAAGLEAVKQQRWDIVLSDVGLGDGSGLGIARAAVASDHPPAHLIALSGYGTRADVEASRRAGFQHHLVKPVDPAYILKLLSGEQPVPVRVPEPVVAR